MPIPGPVLTLPCTRQPLPPGSRKTGSFTPRRMAVAPRAAAASGRHRPGTERARGLVLIEKHSGIEDSTVRAEWPGAYRNKDPSRRHLEAQACRAHRVGTCPPSGPCRRADRLLVTPLFRILINGPGPGKVDPVLPRMLADHGQLPSPGRSDGRAAAQRLRSGVQSACLVEGVQRPPSAEARRRSTASTASLQLVSAATSTAPVPSI
jgi:hypothetical protein